MPQSDARPSLIQALSIYSHPRVLAMLFLGFSAGLPFLLVFSTLSAWLTEVDVARASIGFFSWIGITYSIKVFWSPLVDRIELPFVGRWLGHRRSWILLAQLMVAGGLAGMAYTDPATELGRLAVMALLVAFGSATQDVSIDAWRIEAVAVERQAAMSASYVFGYRIALLVAGAGALHLASFYPWPQVYLVMAGLVFVGILTVLLSPEPRVERRSDAVFLESRAQEFLSRNSHLPAPVGRAGAWFVGAVVCPFADFFSRYGRQSLLILVMVGAYRISDISMASMANPFYLDLGFTKAEIANIAGIWGVGMTILGGMLGGLLVPRYGLLKLLLVGALLVAFTNLLFALMSQVGPQVWMLAITISGDNLSAGLAMAVFIAWLSSLTNTAYTATQYALFSSLMTLPGKVIGGFGGVVVEMAGYAWFFIYASVLGLPAIVLAIWLIRRQCSPTS